MSNKVWLAVGIRTEQKPETPCAISDAFWTESAAEQKANEMRNSRESFERVDTTQRKIKGEISIEE